MACGSGSSGFLGGFGSSGSLAATLGLRWSGRRFSDELSSHNAGNEQLGAVIVKINRGSLLVGRGNNSQAVRFVLNGLSFCHHLHIVLLDHICVVETRFESLELRHPELMEGTRYAR